VVENGRLTPFEGGSKVIFINLKFLCRIPGASTGAVSRVYGMFLTAPLSTGRSILMNDKLHDPIVAEVRKNREEILAEFGGDTKKLSIYLKSIQPEMEAAGFRFVTKEEQQERLTLNRQQQEAIERRFAAF
jgi:hypothetical protein